MDTTVEQNVYCSPPDVDYLESTPSESSSTSSFQSALSTPHFDQEHEPYDDSIFDTSDDESQVDPKERPKSEKMIAVQPFNLQAPALPARSTLRRSKLHAKGEETQEEERPLSRQAVVPHERYLSSEEDASSSADDFSDFDFESDSDFSEGSSSASSSHEIIARAISIIFSGKPTLVSLPPRPRVAPSTQAATTRPGAFGARLRRRPAEQCLYQDERSSLSSERSTAQHPPRKSSAASETQSPSFLHVDPFAGTATKPTSDGGGQLKTPAAFIRKFSLVKKRSKPQLNPSASLTENLSFSQRRAADDLTPSAEDLRLPVSRSESLPVEPVSYQDIVKTAKRNAARQGAVALATPLTPSSSRTSTSSGSGTKGIINSLTHSRRRSLKG